MRLLQVFVTDVLVPLRAHYDILANGVDHSEFKSISDCKTVCRSAKSCGPAEQRAIRRKDHLKGGFLSETVVPLAGQQSCICATAPHATPVVAVIPQSLPLIVFCQGLWLWGGSSWFICRNPRDLPHDAAAVERRPTNTASLIVCKWLLCVSISFGTPSGDTATAVWLHVAPALAKMLPLFYQPKVWEWLLAPSYLCPFQGLKIATDSFEKFLYHYFFVVVISFYSKLRLLDSILDFPQLLSSLISYFKRSVS